MERNANEEKTQKERVLQDLTDSLLRVVSGRPSRRNSGELQAMKAAIATEMKTRVAQSKKKQASEGKAPRGRSKSVPPQSKKIRKRDEAEEPPQQKPGKRAKTGKSATLEEDGVTEDKPKEAGRALRKKTSKEDVAEKAKTAAPDTRKLRRQASPGKSAGDSGKKSKRNK